PERGLHVGHVRQGAVVGGSVSETVQHRPGASAPPGTRLAINQRASNWASSARPRRAFRGCDRCGRDRAVHREGGAHTEESSSQVAGPGALKPPDAAWRNSVDHAPSPATSLPAESKRPEVQGGTGRTVTS